VNEFLAFIEKESLAEVTLDDVTRFSGHLKETLMASTHQRKLAALHSLFRYAHQRGYIETNVAELVQYNRPKDSLAEKLVEEPIIEKLIAAASDNPRNALLLRLLYVSAGRVSEVVGLRWRDLQEREEGGQACIYGKGQKTRYVRLPAALWADLIALQGEAKPDDRVFTICRQHVWRLIKQIASKACVTEEISPHWFRHAHASHALARGATLAQVQKQLGHSDLKTTSRYLHVRPEESSSEYLAIT
jgi:integrase/recombinase XerD